ncbi:Mediator of RNA polymerase II transcription subunit 12 [Balamuthia mandrillaris]
MYGHGGSSSGGNQQRRSTASSHNRAAYQPGVGPMQPTNDGMQQQPPQQQRRAQSHGRAPASSFGPGFRPSSGRASASQHGQRGSSAGASAVQSLSGVGQAPPPSLPHLASNMPSSSASRMSSSASYHHSARGQPSVQHGMPYVAPMPYVLPTPIGRKVLNERLSVADFYPVETVSVGRGGIILGRHDVTTSTQPTPEEELNILNIHNGYREPLSLENEYGSMRTFPLFLPAPLSPQEEQLQSLKEENGNNKREQNEAQFADRPKVRHAVGRQAMLQVVSEIAWMMKCRVDDKDYQAFHTLRKRRGKASSVQRVMSGKPSFPELRPVGKAKEQWIHNLAGSDPLHLLINSVPHGYRNVQLLDALVRFRVPLLRATWYIKVVQLNNKYKATSSKRNRPPSPPDDWTETLIKFLYAHLKTPLRLTTVNPADGKVVAKPADKTKIKELMERFGEISQESGGNNGYLSDAFKAMVKNEEVEALAFYDKLMYILRLIHWNYEEHLLNRKMFLDSLVDKLLELHTVETNTLLLSIVTEYLQDICECKTRFHKLLNYCVVTTYKLLEAGASPRARWRASSQNYLFRSLCNILRYAIQITPPPHIPFIEDQLAACIALQKRKRLEDPSLLSFAHSLFSKKNCAKLVELKKEARRRQREWVLPIATPLDTSMASVVQALDNFEATEKGDMDLLFANLFPHLSSPTTLITAKRTNITKTEDEQQEALAVGEDGAWWPLQQPLLATQATEDSSSSSLFSSSRSGKKRPFAETSSSSEGSSTVSASTTRNEDQTEEKREDTDEEEEEEEEGGENEDDQVQLAKQTVERSKDVLKTLCEWAITKHRRTNLCRTFVTVSLIRRYVQIVKKTTSKSEQENDVDLQSLFTSLLSIPRTKEEQIETVRLFAELIRHKLFSHDAYVRYHISSGTLFLSSVGTENQIAAQQRWYLQQLPLPSSHKREHNQRRAVLRTLPDNGWLDEEQTLNKLLTRLSQFFTRLHQQYDQSSASSSLFPFQFPFYPSSSLSETSSIDDKASLSLATYWDYAPRISSPKMTNRVFCFAPPFSPSIGQPTSNKLEEDSADEYGKEMKASLSETLAHIMANVNSNKCSRYCQSFLNEWLCSCVEKCFPPFLISPENTYQCTAEELQTVFLILCWTKDYYSVAALYFVVLRSASPALLLTLLHVAYEHEQVFTSQALLIPLLNELWRRKADAVNGVQVCHLMAYLYHKYKHTIALKRWSSVKQTLDPLFNKYMESQDFSTQFNNEPFKSEEIQSISALMDAKTKEEKERTLECQVEEGRKRGRSSVEGRTECSLTEDEKTVHDILQGLCLWTMDQTVKNLRQWIDESNRPSRNRKEVLARYMLSQLFQLSSPFKEQRETASHGGIKEEKEESNGRKRKRESTASSTSTVFETSDKEEQAESTANIYARLLCLLSSTCTEEKEEETTETEEEVMLQVVLQALETESTLSGSVSIYHCFQHLLWPQKEQTMEVEDSDDNNAFYQIREQRTFYRALSLLTTPCLIHICLQQQSSSPPASSDGKHQAFLFQFLRSIIHQMDTLWRAALMLSSSSPNSSSSLKNRPTTDNGRASHNQQTALLLRINFLSKLLTFVKSFSPKSETASVNNNTNSNANNNTNNSTNNLKAKETETKTSKEADDGTTTSASYQNYEELCLTLFRQLDPNFLSTLEDDETCFMMLLRLFSALLFARYTPSMLSLSHLCRMFNFSTSSPLDESKEEVEGSAMITMNEKVGTSSSQQKEEATAAPLEKEATWVEVPRSLQQKLKVCFPCLSSSSSSLSSSFFSMLFS